MLLPLPLLTCKHTPLNPQQPNAWNALVNTTRTNDFVDVGGGTNESGSDADNGLGSNPEDRKFHAQTDRGSDDGNPLDAAQQSTENSASLTSSAVGGKPFEGGGAQTAGRKKLRRKIANKSYIEWSCILLREVSRKRGLRVTCRESDKAKMARMLTNQDTVLQRSSPFIADIGGDSGAGEQLTTKTKYICVRPHPWNSHRPNNWVQYSSPQSLRAVNQPSMTARLTSKRSA